jgi:hypothetical protein
MAASKPFMIGLATATLLCASATAFAGTPMMLADRQLDQVTAGLALGLGLGAIASGGPIAITETDGGATGTTTSLPGGGSIETGATGGSAAAVSPGGSVATGAVSGGIVDGNTVLSTGFHGTVSGAGAQISASYSFVTGGTQFIP